MSEPAPAPLDVHRLPGVKAGELRPCALCGGALTSGGLFFYRVRTEQFVIDVAAAQRAAAFEATLGSVALARVMGPDEDVAKRVDSARAFVCSRCAMGASEFPVAAMMGDEC